jgi:Hydantoinase/oxoprolinase N-terminal region/Hydantoinase B/oxoprolinase
MSEIVRAATDVGGTFTDLVFYAVDVKTGLCGAVRTAKVDTTPPNYEQGVMRSLAKGGVKPAELGFFAHGATVVINAITERKGAKVGATSRSQAPPWGSNGGKTGSLNNVKIIRSDGSIETHDMCTRVRVAKGEVIRLTTATGGGFGDPSERSREKVRLDLKNGFVTAAQAERDYGFRP